ncbi:carbohydrate deacetylase [Paenibacillus thalictri]|uniref:ChbG/HpnK family deacetylase n=1 Tax=Paenibacillus thalictri TaxID=2527873 RepID=A0A4Q9DX62_9BACL|nr:ChbG/HpnK family deacetylase [Paenibacillus thalictri]TBL81704.1 ChbG/HpnK family deacetylase [Paenibacillus thalictri]
MPKYAIINADDFGLAPGINRGIIEAYRAGGITSTTLMVNMPGFQDAVQLMRSVPCPGVGLHFNLTYGTPISPPYLVPSLVLPDGRFRNNIVQDGIRDEREIELELEAQWNKFIATGFRPTHLDSHHLLHQSFPAVFRKMARLAVRESIPLRRVQAEHAAAAPAPLTTDFVLLDSYPRPDGLYKLLQYLHTLPEGTTEIMCHPGYVDSTLLSISKWIEIREAELDVFKNPAIAQTMRELDIIPLHYGQLTGEMNFAVVPPAPPELPEEVPAVRPRKKKAASRLRIRGKRRKKRAAFSKRAARSNSVKSGGRARSRHKSKRSAA